MGVTFPGESPAYRQARNRLLEQEIDLRRRTEAVAIARRQLPPGGLVPEDYVFEGAGPDGRPTEIRLSELFAPGRDALVIYSFMFPRAPGDDRPGPTTGEISELRLEDGPCPSCVALLDQLRHFWGSELLYASTEPGQDPRHVGTIEPVWNLFDFTPEGRGGERDEQLHYG
jgi:predicted dithiol-disulfide oxidoreductase (DUF899 family)